MFPVLHLSQTHHKRGAVSTVFCSESVSYIYFSSLFVFLNRGSIYSIIYFPTVLVVEFVELTC